MTAIKKIAFLFFSTIVLSACSSPQQTTSKQSIQSQTTENYTSAFPQRDVSEQLKKAQQSVVRIIGTGFYENYSFSQRYITMSDIRTNDPKDIATDYFSSEESTAGTSIILDQTSQSSLLITAEHVVSFQDTVISYYRGEDIPPQTFVKSISIKKRQSNLAFMGEDLKSYEILAKNRRLDLALIEVDIGRTSNLDAHSLSVNMGNSNLLQLGSFMYILGFPKGYAMVTRGVASSSESWNDRFFISDATFNPGISGGLILASRDNYGSFEWIGIASSATATRENVLVPRPSSDRYSRAVRPYQDSLFVQQRTRINYGITQAVPIDKIKQFLRNNEREINRKGFSISGF